MNLDTLFNNPDEKPLDNIVSDGGFTSVFRTIGCVGDSLSSGEHESLDENGKKGYHDYYEYSWGQYLARSAGIKVYNFSRGGMTAKEYCEGFADSKDFWNIDKRCQGYIIALGVNDLNADKNLGSADDVDLNNYKNNKKTFAGYYAEIIQRYKEIQPKAKFFLMTVPHSFEDPDNVSEKQLLRDEHAKLLYKFAEMFENTYVLDFRKYAPVYDEQFRKKFFLGGHMNAAGYMLTAKMVGSYIDYIVRHNMEDFSQIGFVGTPHHNVSAKW